MRALLIFVVGLGVSLGTSAENWHDGFVLGSRVNVRVTPNTAANNVAALPVGTPVRWRRATGDWCEISPATDTPDAGFIRCDLLTEDRPTLEGIDAELSRPDIATARESDLLARRFYLSPSLNTIGLVRERYKLPAEDHWPNPAFALSPAGAGAAPGGKKGEPTTPGRALATALLEAFAGELTGQDFRPVDLRVNEVVVADMPEFIDAIHRRAYGGAGRTEGEPPRALPAVRPSLFRHAHDVLALGWLVADPDGRAGAVRPLDTPNDVIEFSKLYAGQRLQARHTELVSRRHEAESLYGWHRTGGVDVAFAAAPRAVVIARNRASDARLLRAHARLAARRQTVEVTLTGPLYSDGLVLALAPHVRVGGVARLGTSANPAVYDLNGDGTADLAQATVSTPSEMGEDNKTLSVFVNIGGQWRLALHEFVFYCD